MAFAALLTASIPAARAEPPCGTVVIPPGLGVTSPQGVTGLHPLLGASLYNQQIANVLYRPLLWIDPEHKVDPALSIADHVDVIGNGTGFHVALKPWTWSDGAPITADDVLYFLEVGRRLGETWSCAGQASMPGIIQDFRIDGPHDFTVTLASKVNPEAFILNGLGLLLPLPRHAWGGISTDAMWQRQSDPAFFTVVSGPYKLGRFELSRYLTLQANPAYSGPPPHIARIVVNFLEGTSELRALQSGEADVANLPFAVWDAARGLPGFRLVPMRPANGINYYGLNYRNPNAPDFHDKRVRQAMEDAIDQQAIIRLVYHGSAEEGRGPLPLQPAGMLSPQARAGQFPTRYDPDRARALLTEAGWLPGPDGIRAKDGRRFSFTMLVSAGVDTSTGMAQVAQRGLAAVGIEMHISEVAFTQMIAQTNGDPLGWEAFFVGWTLNPYVEGQTMFGTGGVNNYVGYSDKTMDRLTEAINTDSGDAASFAFQDYAAEQVPVIFMPHGIYAVLVRDGLEGISEFVSPMNTWAPEFLRLTGPMACTDARDHQPS